MNAAADSTFSRRDFLRAASAFGVVTLASPLAAALAPIKRHGAPRLKLGLNAYSFAKLLNDRIKGGAGITLFDLVNFCAKHDVEGLDPTGYFFPNYPKLPPDEFVNELKKRAFESGIGISGTGVRNNFTTADKAVREAGVEHIKEWVEVGARLGAPVVRVFADTQMKAQTWQTISNGATREQVEDWIAGHLRECAEHGKKFGVVIGVQNHGDFLKTSEEHLSLIRRVDSDWCGAIVDTGYYKTDDPYADMARTAPFAVNWQVKEKPFGAGSDVRTDLKKLLTIVRMSGYRGYLPIETLSEGRESYDPFQVVPPFLAAVGQAIEETRDIAPPQAADDVEIAPSQPATTPKKAASPDRAGRKPPNKKKNNPPTAPEQK